ncbi:hypothetical protein ACTXT7_007869 [Hymenolepis weldensis]
MSGKKPSQTGLGVKSAHAKIPRVNTYKPEVDGVEYLGGKKNPEVFIWWRLWYREIDIFHF